MFLNSPLQIPLSQPQPSFGGDQRPRFRTQPLNCDSVLTKIPAAIEVGVYLSHLSLNSKTEFLVNMKADTHDLAQEKENVHGHQTVPSDLAPSR
jgi:hypothetical protein